MAGMTEAQLEEMIHALCRMLGVKYFHPFDSRRSVEGWLDLTLVGRKGVIYRELKTATGKVDDDQERWIAALREAGQNADVWRPADWDSQRIIHEIRELVGRSSFPGPSERTLRRRAEAKIRRPRRGPRGPLS